MRSLFKYLKAYRKEIVLGPVFKLIEAIFELIVPLLMASIIDVGIKNGDSGYVLRMGGLMIAFSAIGFTSTLVCQFFAAKASQGFGTVLRSRMFSHIGSLSHADIDKIGVSTLTTRITNDINQLQVGVAMFIRLAIRAPFLVIGATVMAMNINMGLSVIFIATAAGITAVLYLIMSRSVPFYTAIQKLLDRVVLLVRENLGGARVIRAFSRQESEKENFLGTSNDVMRASVRVGKLAALLNPLTYLIVNVGIIAILWFGGRTVDTGVLEQGQIVAMVNYMTQIMLALVVVANLVIIFTRAGASATRVAEVLDTEPGMAEGKGVEAPGKTGYAVEFDNVSFSYVDGEKYALCDVSLKIEKGQTVGIIGGTGSGKTTLVDMIPRFYDATKGVVSVDGEDVRDYTFGQLRGKIGMVPQKAQLFYGTIRDNMRWGDKNASDEQINEALEVGQAAEFVNRYADGLDHKIMQDGRNLSGGQRQRLTIARALVGGPDILILDDSASALDFATDAALRKALKNYGDGVTVIMVSQRASTLKNADKIVVMDDGRIVGAGTHDELFEANEIYREICLSQMEAGGAKA